MIIILRPHHILCRLGYVGYGYSPEFISEMGRMVKAMQTKRVKMVIPRPGFDNICRSCPHQEGECAPGQIGVRGQAYLDIDRRTLRTLKLKSGFTYPLPEINERIAALSEPDFDQICVGCEWRALGDCRRGYQTLRQEFFPDKK